MYWQGKTDTQGSFPLTIGANQQQQVESKRFALLSRWKVCLHAPFPLTTALDASHHCVCHVMCSDDTLKLGNGFILLMKAAALILSDILFVSL